MNTVDKTMIGMIIIPLKLMKKSNFTKHPTPVREIKSKLNGDVKRKKFIKPRGHGILNALSLTLKI